MAIALEERARSLAELDTLRPLVEATIGRELREAERAIDVLGLDEALNAAKDDLHAAIEREKKRAIRRALRRLEPVHLELTGPMLEPLERLYRLGRREAYAELERAGYEPRRAFAAEPQYEDLDEHGRFVQRELGRLSAKIDGQLVSADLSGASQAAIERALFRILGARNIASLITSGALTAGLAATFEQNLELVDARPGGPGGGWEYSAVLDGATCEICGPLDGTTYTSWAEIQGVLPNGGPNSACFGGGRCRCRAVPRPTIA